MSIKKVDILKEFERIDGKEGTYRMILGNGESIIYQNGRFGTYWHKGSDRDQVPTWMTREEAIEKATDYLVVINKLNIKDIFDGFEDCNENFWK